MALPYYVSPEQMMQDKAEYAKKGIAKGRSIVAMEYQDGILIVADNPSMSLNKISEIYDNIAFLGAGRYSEFENLRKAGIRHADLKGYLYSREDVTAKSLANAYSQALGTTFSQEVKPLEIEIAVVAVGETAQSGEIYRISFDGSITDERGFTIIGGRAEAITLFLRDRKRVIGEAVASTPSSPPVARAMRIDRRPRFTRLPVARHCCTGSASARRSCSMAVRIPWSDITMRVSSPSRAATSSARRRST